MSPIYLELIVVLIGIFLLMFEAFVPGKDKTVLAWAGAAGLGFVLLLSFFVQAPVEVSPLTGYRQFYRADALAMFFKQFALVTTIVILIMSVEYKGVVSRYIYGATPEAGLGEFFALPVFTCAGLMWMASAVDFILI